MPETDLREGVSQAAGIALDELDLMDAATDPDILVKAAQAELATVTGMQNPAAKAGRLCLAAARLIRAAEILGERADG